MVFISGSMFYVIEYHRANVLISILETYMLLFKEFKSSFSFL